MTDSSLSPQRSERRRRQIQRGVGGAVSGSRESSEAAEHLERLLGDKSLIMRLQLYEFDPDSEDWKAFASALIGYGYDVFRSWFGTGKIHEKLKEKSVYGRQSVRTTQLRSGDEQDIATHLMLTAIEPFRKTLISGKWRHDGGASLASYFIGHCLFQVPKAFSGWRQLTSASDGTVDPDKIRGEGSDGGTGRVELRMIAEEHLVSLPHKVRPMFELQGQGLRLEEIATRLGTTEGAVRSAMSRHRKTCSPTEELPWMN